MRKRDKRPPKRFGKGDRCANCGNDRPNGVEAVFTNDPKLIECKCGFVYEVSDVTMKQIESR